MKTPHHIVWDWNGTLQNDVQAAVNGINRLLIERGLPPVDIEKHRRLFSFPVSNYYTALGFKLEEENWDLLAKHFTATFYSDPSTTLFDDTIPTLNRLHAHGVGMSILSASEQTTLEHTLSTHGIRNYFSIVKGLNNHSAGSKLHLADELFAAINTPVEDVWLVGDTTHDKEVADAAGCACVLLASGYQSRERLADCGCPVLDSVSEIPAFFGFTPERNGPSATDANKGCVMIATAPLKNPTFSKGTI